VGFPAWPGEIDAYINACAAAVPYTSVSLGGYFFGADTLARAELAYHQGDLNKAEQFARQAVYQSREKNQYEVENRALFYLLRICVHRGDIAGIQEMEQQMKTLLEKGEYLNRYSVYDIIMGRFYARIGLTEKIAPWLKKEPEEWELNVLFRGFDTLINVRCLLIEKKYSAALQALEEEKINGELGTFLLGFLEMTTLKAVIRHKLGDKEGAFLALKKAYDASAPNGLYIPFVELGDYMHNLLGAFLKTRQDASPAEAPRSKDPDAQSAEIPHEWLQTIRRDASAFAKKRSIVAAYYSGREKPAFSDFSRHELAILGNLANGLTSEEIAGGMNISVKMVKSAVRSLYVKLGAANKADAIRIATERGLLTKTGTDDIHTG
jgi:LuxR family maltose regulon positive regulatory protein